jgi:hypothetical protein
MFRRLFWEFAILAPALAARVTGEATKPAISFGSGNFIGRRLRSAGFAGNGAEAASSRRFFKASWQWASLEVALALTKAVLALASAFVATDAAGDGAMPTISSHSSGLR